MTYNQQEGIPVYPRDARSSAFSATILDGAATSNAVPLHQFTRGLIRCPAGVAGPITFTAAVEKDGTYTNINAVSLTISLATEWEEIPDAVMKAGWVKFVNGAGNVTGNQTIDLLLKS